MDEEQTREEASSVITGLMDDGMENEEDNAEPIELTIAKFSIKKRVLAILISVIIISLGVFGVNAIFAYQSPSNRSKDIPTMVPSDIKWNTSELDASKNGNIGLAVNLFRTNTKQVPFYLVNAGIVIKRPWEYYGKMLKIMGRVLSVQDYPPDDPMSIKLGGSSAEAVVQGFDGMLINYLIIGNSGNMSVGAYAVLYGYTPGIAYVDSYGTTIPELALIGNPVSHPTTKSAEEAAYKQLSDRQKSEEQSAMQAQEQAKQRAQQQSVLQTQEQTQEAQQQAEKAQVQKQGIQQYIRNEDQKNSDLAAQQSAQKKQQDAQALAQLKQQQTLLNQQKSQQDALQAQQDAAALDKLREQQTLLNQQKAQQQAESDAQVDANLHKPQ